jgi:hypothetical protein
MLDERIKEQPSQQKKAFANHDERLEFALTLVDALVLFFFFFFVFGNYEGVLEGFVAKAKFDLFFLFCFRYLTLAITAAESDLHAGDLNGLLFVQVLARHGAFFLLVLLGENQLTVGFLGGLG